MVVGGKGHPGVVRRGLMETLIRLPASLKKDTNNQQEDTQAVIGTHTEIQKRIKRNTSTHPKKPSSAKTTGHTAEGNKAEAGGIKMTGAFPGLVRRRRTKNMDSVALQTGEDISRKKASCSTSPTWITNECRTTILLGVVGNPPQLLLSPPSKSMLVLEVAVRGV